MKCTALFLAMLGLVSCSDETAREDQHSKVVEYLENLPDEELRRPAFKAFEVDRLNSDYEELKAVRKSFLIDILKGNTDSLPSHDFFDAYDAFDGRLVERGMYSHTYRCIIGFDRYLLGLIEEHVGESITIELDLLRYYLFSYLDRGYRVPGADPLVDPKANAL